MLDSFHGQAVLPQEARLETGSRRAGSDLCLGEVSIPGLQPVQPSG